MGYRQEKIAFLRRIFGGMTVSGDGINVAVRCPNNQCGSLKKGKRKLSIQIMTDQSHCWVCGSKTRNTLVPILRRVCTPSEIQEYVKRFSPKSVRFLGIDDNVPEEDVVRLPEGYQMLALSQGSRSPSVRRAINYLKKRGLGEAVLWKYKLGIATENQFDRRVIIPSFDSDGYLNTYAARAVDRRAFPPYKIPPVERAGIIFNELFIDWKSEITLVEGPFDLMKCVGNATCLQGSFLSEDHLLFWRIVTHKTPVVLALDTDAKRKSVKIAKLLASYDVPLRIMDLGRNLDVGEMTSTEFTRAHRAARPWTSMEGLRMTIDAWSPASGST